MADPTPKNPVLVPRPTGDQRPPARRSRDHHLDEWASGERGGGMVPEDFSWKTNPKQWQEEHGAAQPKDKRKDD